MAEFTISGQRNGAHVEVTWRDGALSSSDGDATARVVQQVAAEEEGRLHRYGMAPATTRHHLRSPYTTCALIRSVFPGPVTQDQPLPPLDLPPGAIA